MDIVERLRDTASKGVSVWGDLQIKAADELEILAAEGDLQRSTIAKMQAEIDRLREMVQKLISATDVTTYGAAIHQARAALKEATATP